MANSNYDEVHVVSDSEEDEVQEGWTGGYHPSFPNEWTISHEPGTGPEQCNNCADYGSYQGQFIGYCANCAVYVYEGRRGRGFINICTELSTEQTRKWASAYETYLSHVEFARFSDELSSFAEDEISYDEVSDDLSVSGLELVGQNTVFEAHFEGGYVDF